MCTWPSIKVADNTLFTDEVTYGDYCTIGGSGFGYVRHGEEILRIPHLGKVEIGQRVVLHNHVNIDRGVVGSTVIGDDCKLDSFVHLAHGVKMGKGNTLAAHTIIEGSCEIGENNTFGTGVIVQRKVKIGKNNIFGSGCVVTKDIGDSGVYVGNPARSL
jgi:UDP-3-O-[3-hydroxymyristoyl] glucosamine N-acyltransferase